MILVMQTFTIKEEVPYETAQYRHHGAGGSASSTRSPLHTPCPLRAFTASRTSAQMGYRSSKRSSALKKIYASIDDMLADDQIDAVLVCSSTDTHADIAIQAAKAGKHIFCEKPVDLTPEKVEAVLKAVEQAGVNCRWASTAALTTTLRVCASWSIRRRSVNWSLSRSPPATRSRHPRNTRRARAACSSI